MKVEKRAKSPLVNLKLEFNPTIFTGNIIMLMYGILEYIIITATPQFRSFASAIWIGIRPCSYRIFTAGFRPIIHDLWAGFRDNGSKKKRI